jgi:hypothetical protein
LPIDFEILPHWVRNGARFDQRRETTIETLLAEQHEAAQVQGGAHAQPEKTRWRMKAAEFRTVADQTKSPQTQSSYRRLAETYEWMAQGEEDRAAREALRKPEAG